MNHSLINKILTKYNLSTKIIYQIEKGYRNKIVPVTLRSGQKVTVIFYKNEPKILNRINNANKVSNYLANKGWPTRKTITTNHYSVLKLSTANKSQFVCLYNYLPGSTICWESYTMKHLKLLGKTLSNLHYELKQIPTDKSSLPLVIDEISIITNDMKHYFSKRGVQKAVIKKLHLQLNPKVFDYFDLILNKISKIEARQPLHMDFVRSNILFNKGDNSQAKLKITGIIDFEKTAIGPTIIDIARTLAFLIVDCKYKREVKVRKYFLHSGYYKRGTSNITNINLLNPLISLFWFHDFYKFSLHNPYESLEDNLHYIKTKKQLIKNNLLKTIE